MTIGSITPILPTLPQQNATANPDPVQKPLPAKAPEETKSLAAAPAPAIRPTLQDRIDVNRTLRLMRQV